MTTNVTESGYLGTINIDNDRTTGAQVSRLPTTLKTGLTAGEPTYAPWAEDAWANELKAPDGNFRFLKSGSAVGRGKAGSETLFDAMLDNNFTILVLQRYRQPNWHVSVDKFTGTYGFQFQTAPRDQNIGTYVRLDAPTQLNQNHVTTNNPAKAWDKNWHWHGFSRATANIRIYLDANAQTLSMGVTGSLQTAADFRILPAQNDIAAVLIFNRVLSDTEVTNIMSGKTLPKSVAGLQAYYKLNEGTGTVCTDYSGNSNHLTYSIPMWETYCPGNLTSAGDFTDASKWIASAGFIIGGGKVHLQTPAAGATIQDTKCVTQGAGYGAKFLVSYTISNYVSGNVRILVYGDNNIYGGGATRTSNGTYSEVITLTAFGGGSNIAIVQEAYSGNTVLDVSNLSITPITQFGLSGQPYVNRQQLDTTKWYNRRPRAKTEAALQGSLAAPTGGYPVVPASILNGAFVGDCSVAVWLKVSRWRNATGTNMTANPFFRYATNYSPFGFTIEAGNKRAVVYFGDNTTTRQYEFQLSVRPPLNTWMFGVFTKLGTTMSVYLNGVLAATPMTADHTLVPAANGSTNYKIGGESQAGSDFAYMRSTRVLTRALSAAEIEELYRTDVLSNRAGLVAEWMMNDLSGTAPQDTSGNGLHSITASTGLGVLDSPYIANRPKRLGKQLKTRSGSILVPVGLADAVCSVASPVLTVSAWLKGNLTNNADRTLSLEDSIYRTMLMFYPDSIAQNWSLAARSNPFAGLAYGSHRTLNTKGQYHHLAAELHFTNKTIKWYIDGVLVTSLTSQTAQLPDAYLGGGVAGYKLDHITVGEKGSVVDSFRIYNRVLSAEEHRNLFFDQAPRSNLLCEYLFEQADIDNGKCMDTSGNNFHGNWNNIVGTDYVSEY